LVSQASPQRRLPQTDRGIGLLLTQICRAHRNRVATALDEISVHVGQDHFVYRLAIEEGITQSHLAEALSLDASTVTKTLLRLERDGVVERRADSGDARVSRVYLTARGRALLNPVVKVWTRAEQQLVKGLSPADRARLTRLLQQVLANLS
jgi:MarR family transcriptional regulator, organic hydroperoxide resistance regulator